MSLKQRAAQLKTDIPALFIALKAKQTPWYVKAVAAIALAYALSPIDLIPDFIPVLGLLDDLIILPALVALAIKLMPKGLFCNTAYKHRGCGKTASQKNGILLYL